MTRNYMVEEGGDWDSGILALDSDRVSIMIAGSNMGLPFCTDCGAVKKEQDERFCSACGSAWPSSDPGSVGPGALDGPSPPGTWKTGLFGCFSTPGCCMGSIPCCLFGQVMAQLPADSVTCAGNQWGACFGCCVLDAMWLYVGFICAACKCVCVCLCVCARARVFDCV